MTNKEKETINKLAFENTIKVNNASYNESKLLEELMELGEILIKRINKTPEKRPSQNLLIEEMGDVILRCKILMIQEDIKEQVKERISFKINQINTYEKEGKYTGGR